MKITPVTPNNQNFGIKFPKINKNKKTQELRNYSTTPLNQQDLRELLQTQEQEKVRKTRDDRLKLKAATDGMTPSSEKVYSFAFDIAQIAHSKEVESWHIFLASLITMRNYIAQVEEGAVDPVEETLFRCAVTFPNMIYANCNLWANDDLIKGAAEVLDKHIAIMMDKYVKKDQQEHPHQRITPPTISALAIRDLYSSFETFKKEADTEDFWDSFFMSMPVFTQNVELKCDFINMMTDLQNLGMTQKPAKEEKHHIEFYDKKADAVWKNIAHGNNVVVLNNLENSQSLEYLKSSFVNLINKPGNKYGSLDPKKINIIQLNENATFTFVEDTIRDIKNKKTDRDTTTVIMGDFLSLLTNCGNQVDTDIVKMLYGTKSDDKNEPNIRFVFTMPPEVYHANTDTPIKTLYEVLTNYAQQTLPMLNAGDAKEYLANESGLEFIKAKVKKEVSKETIYKAIEVTSSKIGNYPEKAINLIDATGKFFVDSEEITPEQIEIYLKETESLSDVSDTAERSIVFDTGKTLGDIKGMPMTTAEAKSIVRQIKNGTVGTRGFVIQHNHGSSYGGGRRHTAEAIAGETGIPMVIINAKDFALKDIDTLSQQAGLSEIKIKKLIQTARAQAEANPLDTAMIYIENFDNFGSNPLYGISSIYEQKAFTQLLAEMEAARKEGKVNLVVIGSMNMPETLDENILKPYKFLNQVIVYQPQDATQRREVLDYYIEKNGYNIADNFEGQKETILNNISESTQYFSVVDLIYLLDQANIISKEREKDEIDGADFTESFLQISSGRTNTAQMSEAGKKIVTSHETGHALNLHLMYEIFKKQGVSWHLPQKVDFITLDPRGSFGGAMFYKESENEEYSFERIMSDIITDYGGHSAENILYGMRGSWGISEDMRMADHSAKLAVTIMGMGQNTGVRHMAQDDFLSDNQKENVAKDVERILKSGKKISDMIVEEYKEFIEEFTQRHYSKVATGECIIPASQFTKELSEWREKQTPEKIEKLAKLERQILGELQACKGSVK